MRAPILLDSKPYFLVPETYQRATQVPLYPRFSNGEPSLTDLSFWQYIQLTDFSGGAGQKDYKIANKFWRSSGIIPSAEEFQKGHGGYPAWSLPAVVSCIHNGSTVLATDARLVALGLGAITAMVSWQGILWVAVGPTLYRINHLKSILNESFAANLNVWVDLTEKNIETATVMEKVQYGNFEAGKDYIMDYREGRIMILSSGRMKENQNYAIKYTWAEPTKVDPYKILASAFSWHEEIQGGATIKKMKWYQLLHQKIEPGTFAISSHTWDGGNIRYDGYPHCSLQVDKGRMRLEFDHPLFADAFVLLAYKYEVLTDTAETINGSYNTWINLGEKLVQPGSELVIYDTTVVGNPEYSSVYSENIDYILDRTLGRIKCLSTGRMKQGNTYYINYDYEDPEEFAGAAKVDVIPDGSINELVAYDKLYLIANSADFGYIYESDGKAIVKTVELAGLVLKDLVLWKGVKCFSGGRTVLGEQRGYLYQYPGKLLLEMKDDSGEQTIRHIYPGEQLYCYLTNLKVYAWNELGYYLVSGTEGYLYSSELAGNTPLIDKLFNQITIEFKDENHNLTLTVQKVDGGDSEALRLDKVEDNTYSANLPAQYISAKIILKFVLNDTNTIVRRVIVRYVPAALLKKTWVFTIKAENNLRYADGTYEQRSGEEIEEDLWALRDENKIIDFIDIDEQKYSVIMQSLSHLSLGINSEDKQEGEITMSILEV